MKFDCVFDRLERRLVTPYAGVWIEMYAEFLEQFGCRVTPYAGVWIEIAESGGESDDSKVTPYAGVWIEI